MTERRNDSSAELAAAIKEQNELLRAQNAMLKAESFREDMRGLARRWDQRTSVRLGFVKNPYGKWR